MKYFFPTLSILAGIYWSISGYTYGLWIRKGPGGGFMPLVAGILAVIFGIILLIINKKDKGSCEFSFRAFIPVGSIIVLLLTSYLIGIILSIALFIFIWLRFFEKYKVLNSLITSIACSGILFLVFVQWLNVPLPSGILNLV